MIRARLTPLGVVVSSIVVPVACMARWQCTDRRKPCCTDFECEVGSAQMHAQTPNSAVPTQTSDGHLIVHLIITHHTASFTLKQHHLPRRAYSWCLLGHRPALSFFSWHLAGPDFRPAWGRGQGHSRSWEWGLDRAWSLFFLPTEGTQATRSISINDERVLTE